MSKSVMTDFRRFLAPVKKIKVASALHGDFWKVLLLHTGSYMQKLSSYEKN